MKRATGLTLLLACLVLVPLSHVDLASTDDSWLLMVDGRAVDVRGHAAEQWNRLRRDCRHMQAVAATAPWHGQALRAMRQYSPPDSASAQLQQLLRHQDWAVAEVRFARLQSAVVLLRDGPAGLAIVPQGIWSGSTHPHRYSAFVRRYLKSQVPQAPSVLIDCFDPQDAAGRGP